MSFYLFYFLALNVYEWVTVTCNEEVSMLLQSLAVLADHMVKTQVQLVEGQGLLGVGSRFTCWIVVSFLWRSEVGKL